MKPQLASRGGTSRRRPCVTVTSRRPSLGELLRTDPVGPTGATRKLGCADTRYDSDPPLTLFGRPRSVPVPVPGPPDRES